MAGQRTLARGAASLLVALLALLVGGPAYAEDGAIAHVESTGDGIRILVDVPGGAQVDLDGVSATLDDEGLDATATSTSSGSAVRRTTVLVIDTSNSMRKQGRFEAAQQAATTYLDAVPDDVEVGIVTFDSRVEVALAPTTDRAAARTVIDGLSLQRNTLLYDGIIAATAVAGDSGQRSAVAAAALRRRRRREQRVAGGRDGRDRGCRHAGPHRRPGSARGPAHRAAHDRRGRRG